MSSTKTKQTFKVLCLHGYRQTIESFKSKSGGFRGLLKNRLEFVFIEGPHLVPVGEQNPNGEKAKSWWFSGVNPDYFSSSHESDICKGFDESLELIKNTLDTQGPFDGLLGFSQGSALAALICCLKALNAKLSQKLQLRVIDGTLEYNVLLQPDIFLIFQEFEYNPKFVVLISGFKSLSKSHLELFDRLNGRLIDIPSLHIIGETDQIIGKAKSEHLMQYFSEPMVVYHSGRTLCSVQFGE